MTLRFNVRDVEASAAALGREPWGTVGDFTDPDGNRGALRVEASFPPARVLSEAVEFGRLAPISHPPPSRRHRMNKSELSSRVAADASLSKAEAGTLIDAVFSTISEALARGETVAIAGFGTFSTQARAARQGRNPRTGEPLAIAASKAPAFKAGKALRDAVRG